MTSTCNIPQLDEAAFEKAVLASPLPVFVHFAERDCEACQLAMPCLAEVMGQVRGPVKCFCIHGTKHPGVAARYRVAQCPSILVFRDGRVARRLVGYPLPGELEVILRTAVA